MGCVTGYRKILELLGHEVIMPEKPTQRTIDLGVLYSPEFICYPFKVMLGTYIEACEKGAEVIVSSGGSGPCRAGLYGEVHRRILNQLGYNVEVIVFDSIFEDFGLFSRRFFKIKNRVPLVHALRHMAFTFRLICQMDEIEKLVKQKRAYELEKGGFNRCWRRIVRLHMQCNTFRQLKEAKRKSYEMLARVPVRKVNEEQRVRIGIVGEIYVIMESAVNMDVEQRLTDMGAEVYNVQYISDWVKHNTLPKWMNRENSWKMYDKAKKYKTCNCGGHDMENTGWIVDFAEKGFDGIVHLLPFGCLPELVTRSIIPKMSEELDIPVLSISLDEQQGEANTQTRIEAFVELCRSRKKGDAANMPIKSDERNFVAVEAKEYAAARR
jgi:predicted nucleotide-binding protein (sugar kinase/HSP70/actin superfamily)